MAKIITLKTAKMYTLNNVTFLQGKAQKIDDDNVIKRVRSINAALKLQVFNIVDVERKPVAKPRPASVAPKSKPITTADMKKDAAPEKPKRTPKTTRKPAK